MSDDVHQVFSKPNYPVLDSVAKELGVTITLDEGVKIAEEFMHIGLPPGADIGPTPMEAAYLRQLLPVVQEKNIMPVELHVYLTDRGFFKGVPETVGTLIYREKKRTFEDLIGGIEQASQTIREQLRK